MQLRSQTAAVSASAYSAFADIVRDIYHKYWPTNTPEHFVESETRRYSWALRMLVSAIDSRGVVVDIGGGWGAFSCACATVGFKAIMVDDCGDLGYDSRDPRYDMPRDFGVEIVRRDVAQNGVDFAADSIDGFTSFDSVEHWHVGPKKAFRQMIQALRPGGLFFISGPNCNDFIKRITVPLGVAQWSPFECWYDEPVFRSHVRELSVRDFKLIARDLNLTDVSVYGRNDSFLLSRRAVVRAIGRPLDYLLRLRPSLCSSIYLSGRKPSSQPSSS